VILTVSLAHCHLRKIILTINSLAWIETSEELRITKQSSAPTGKANDDYYNLSGQRVGKDYKGIVIKNGKKYVQK
jgi:hypothetical protein